MNLRPFTEGDSIDTEPTFSPDGKYIYFTSDRAATRRFTENLWQAVQQNASASAMPMLSARL